MHIVMCEACTIGISPSVGDIPSHAGTVPSTGPVGVRVVPQLSVTVGGVGNTMSA